MGWHLGRVMAITPCQRALYWTLAACGGLLYLVGRRHPAEAMMRFQSQKYWHDLLLPVLRQDQPPTVPQAVVVQDQQVLLVQRDTPRFWELPGGSMLPGETPEAAVVREVQEETGVQVEIVELLGWYARTGFRAHHSPVYVCRPRSGLPQVHDADTIQARYFPLYRLPRGLCPWYRSMLQHDLLSLHPRPLRCTQHLGLWTVLHCIGLDLAGRLGLLSAGERL